MVGFNFQLTLAVLAKTVFDTGAAQFGLLTTALAVGALGGALASSVRRTRPSGLPGARRRRSRSALLETLVGFAPTFWITALLLVPTGFFMIFFAQAANQRVQLGTDAAYRGRVMALYVLVFLGTTPVGALADRLAQRALRAAARRLGRRALSLVAGADRAGLAAAPVRFAAAGPAAAAAQGS